jgi:FkbM family methyltransferase
MSQGASHPKKQGTRPAPIRSIEGKTLEKDIRIGDRIYTVASDDDYLNAVGDDFEPHMVQLFRSLIGPQDIVADIGANIGLTALLFASLARGVIAFEPSPSTYRFLVQNLERAEATKVEAVNLGLGDKAGSLTITFARNNRSGGYVSDKIRPETGHVTEEIRIETLDDFFSARPIVPNFLKIDVEGFELNVLRGAGRFLADHQPRVVMEMNHFCLDVLHRITIPDFLDCLRAIFPRLHAVDTDNRTIIDLHDPEQAYFVMYQHVVHHRFPNLVCGFDDAIASGLKRLAEDSARPGASAHARAAGGVRRLGRWFEKTVAKGTRSDASFRTPPVEAPAGTIHPEALPDRVGAGRVMEIPVILTNGGGQDWYGYGTHPVRLCYHWFGGDGRCVVHDGVRTALKNRQVHAGASVRQRMNVTAPDQAGRYRVMLTVVQEGVCWFEDRGFQPFQGLIAVEETRC